MLDFYSYLEYISMYLHNNPGRIVILCISSHYVKLQNLVIGIEITNKNKYPVVLRVDC